MMKKNLLNKHVVKAISLGLSAVMLTTPMQAMAAEGESGSEPASEVNAEKKESESSTKATSDAITDARDTISNETPGSNVVVDDDIDVILPSTVTEDDLEGERIANVPDAVEATGADALSGVTTEISGKDVTYEDVIGEATEGTEGTDDINTGLLRADAELEDAEESLSAVKNAEDHAKTNGKNANSIINEINTNSETIANANTEAQKAANAAADALEEAKSATTKIDCQVAVDAAEEAAKAANEQYEIAKEAYEANAGKLEAAKKAVDEAKKALDEAQRATETTATELKAAQDAVDAAVYNAEALKAQVDKDADILSKSQDAALKAAYDKMMAIKNVTNLYDGDSFDSDGVDDEFIDRFGSESAGGGYWDAADDYFELYLKCVYADKYLGGEWTRKNELNNGLNYLALRDNVFTVRYIDDDGNEATALYNYHTADKDGNISIYEKEIATKTIEAVTVEYWTERKNTTNDQKIKDAINGVETLLAEMKAKQDAAAIALAAVLQAQKDVKKAQLELDDLKIDLKAKETLADAQQKALEDAQKALEEADENYVVAISEKNRAQQAYEDALKELDRFNPTGGGDGTDPTPDTTPDPTVVPLATPVAVPTVVAPVTLAAGVAQAVVAIDDEATPLAGGIRAAEPEAADEKEEAVVAIEDEATPLAAALPSAEEKANMSWWWLLIIAILGATGYKMYKDHQKKKEEATQEA